MMGVINERPEEREGGEESSSEVRVVSGIIGGMVSGEERMDLRGSLEVKLGGCAA